MGRLGIRAACAALTYAACCTAQTTTSSTTSPSACPSVLTPEYQTPVVGAGWTAQLVVTGLTKPRGIMFDDNGALLVVQQGTGILHVTFTDEGGTCLFVKDTKNLVENSDLNHAVELSADGKTLYASTSESVYSWAYDAAAGSVSKDNVTLISNMSNTDHVSRTLLLSRKVNGTLLVSRGSGENMDFGAQEVSSGISQIKAFDLNKLPDGRPYDYPSEGTLIGWGLRNSVGVAEHPTTGGIYSVENSADQIKRSGTDIHQDDPGEEMNYHGFLNRSDELHGKNYGYPDCFALWGTDIPDKGSMKVGDQFTLDPSSDLNDTTCADNYVSPRLTFQAHTAPLDMKFTPDGAEAYITFHGSWNRDEPVGYKLSSVKFSNGEPVEPSDSTTSTDDILSNADLSACPSGCFRPVGVALDSQGRLWMSSDSTGEIYVLQKADMTALGPSGTSSASGSGTLVTSTSTTSPNIAPRSARNQPGQEALWLTFLAISLSFVGGAFFAVA